MKMLSKIPFIRRVLLAGFLVAVISGGFWVANDSIRSQASQPGAIADEVTLRLLSAEYSSTKTVLTLEVQGDFSVESESGLHFSSIDPKSLTVSGFDEPVLGEWGPLLDQLSQVSGQPGTDIVHLVLPPIRDPNEAVRVEISELCAVTSASRACHSVDGQWTVETLPGEDGIDPIRDRRVIGAEQTADGITIQLLELARSSNEVVIAYAIESGMDAKPIGPGLQAMVLEDGSVLEMAGQRHRRDGVFIASFPPLPEGYSGNVHFSGGNYLRQDSLAGASIEVRLADYVSEELPALHGDQRVDIPVGRDVPAGDYSVRMDAIQVGGGDLVIYLASAAGGDPVMFGGMDGGVFLTDSAGNGTRIWHRLDSFPQQAGGLSAGVESLLVFRPDADSEIDSFVLWARIGHVVSPAHGFNVAFD